MIRYKCWLVLSLSLVAAALGFFPLAQTSGQRSQKIALAASPEPIYARDPNDAWNRIFYFLFSRRIETRLSDEFPEGAPFSEQPLFQSDIIPKIHASLRVFERTEIGDRAIDPFYPSLFSSTGSELVLAEPAYSEFVEALQDALNESAPRPTIARGLMESDLWAAHDMFSLSFTLPAEKDLEQRRQRVVDLLSLLIKKVALTPDEIKTLPDNYAAAVQRHSLPDLFRKDGGWVEVRWFPHRMHDASAGYRRVARIFVKPAHPPQDMRKFLNALPDSTDTPAALDGVALVTQLLLIDAQGKLQPTKLTTEIQARIFEKTNAGAFKRTTLQVAEISRKLLAQEPESGGLIPEDEAAPNYLSSAGNDYSFASGQIGSAEPYNRPPVQVKLRTRCAFCHGNNDLTFLMSFGIARPPHFRVPPVRQLDAAGHEAADFVMEQKGKQTEFKALRAYFGGARAAAIHW
jgi:hypothetical protein